MFDLVFKHQQPRITSYLEWLKRAFGPEKSTAHRPSKGQATLLKSWVETQPVLQSRTWIDDSGFEFEIPTNPLAEADKVSEAVLTGESFKDLDVSVGDLFSTIHNLCREEVSQETQDILLKQLMHSLFDLWKGARTQSAVKAYLHRHFGENRKRKREAEKALLFLCKIYHGVYTFIEAAERLRIFKSVECVPVRYNKVPGPNNDANPRQRIPLEVAKNLGVPVYRADWIDYLSREGSRFSNLLKEKRNKRHFHAEIQILHHHDFLLSLGEKKHTHPYIGCSRRCCFLCYFFILAHGCFRVRGTHKTVMHRWEIPNQFPVGNTGAITKFRLATERLSDTVKSILRDLFKMSYPISKPELLAQSSDALSSTQVVLEKELERLEKSHQELQ